MDVHRLGFGAMACAVRCVGRGLDPSAAKRALTHAVQLGITLIDTADAYGPEVNERFIAETLYPYPEGLVVATKGGLTTPARGLEHETAGPNICAPPAKGVQALAAGADRSLSAARARPRVPWKTPLARSLICKPRGTRHIGLSNVSIDELRRAQHIVPIVSVQNRYNVSHRASEDVLPVCEKEGIASSPGTRWPPAATSPLAVRSLGSRAATVRPQSKSGSLAACPLAGDGANFRYCFGGDISKRTLPPRVFACRQRI